MWHELKPVYETTLRKLLCSPGQIQDTPTGTHAHMRHISHKEVTSTSLSQVPELGLQLDHPPGATEHLRYFFYSTNSDPSYWEVNSGQMGCGPVLSEPAA